MSESNQLPVAGQDDGYFKTLLTKRQVSSMRQLPTTGSDSRHRPDVSLCRMQMISTLSQRQLQATLTLSKAPIRAASKSIDWLQLPFLGLCEVTAPAPTGAASCATALASHESTLRIILFICRCGTSQPAADADHRQGTGRARSTARNNPLSHLLRPALNSSNAPTLFKEYGWHMNQPCKPLPALGLQNLAWVSPSSAPGSILY